MNTLQALNPIRALREEFLTTVPARGFARNIRGLRSDVAQLSGGTRNVSPRLGNAARKGFHEEFIALWMVRYLYVVLAVATAILFYVLSTADPNDIRLYLTGPWTGFWEATLDWERTSPWARAFILGSIILITATLLETASQWRRFRMKRRRRWPRKKYPLILAAVSVIGYCSFIARREEVEPRALRNLAIAIEIACSCILRIPAFTGTLPFRSHRRAGLGQHSKLVVAALQQAERKLDTDRDQALKDIADLMLTISERYVDGRVGALLDESQLSGLEPVANREWMRLLTAIVLTVSSALGIALLGLPSSAVPYVMGGVGLLCFTAVFGQRSSRTLDLLDSVRGVQRP